MPLTRQPIKALQTVKILVDPNPQLVSLVGHGANQTPFLTIKAAHSPTMKPAPTAPPAAQTSVTKGKDTPPTEIHKMLFKGDKFANTEAVTAYLTAKGYTGFTIEAAEKDFVVKGIDETAFKAIAPIVGEDGVTMWVGELLVPLQKEDPAPAPAEGETASAPTPAPAAENPPVDPPAPAPVEPAPAAEQTPAEKAAEITARTRTREGAPMLAVKNDKLAARKVDTWLAYYDSNDTTIAGILSDANDGIPVGFYDIENAFIGALKNLVLAGNVAGIKALCAEFGTIIQKLATLTAGVEKADDRAEATKSLFKAAAAAIAAPQTAVAKGADDITAQLAELKGLLVASQKEAKEAKETAEKANLRATSLEQIRQTRKSAETTEVAIPTHESSPASKQPATKGKRTAAQKMEDNLLGIRNDD